MDPSSENRLLKRALALYAGEHVLEHVLRNGNDALRPQGELTEATLLFVDVAGFTTSSKAMTPDDLTALISSWLDLITTQLVVFDGTLDAYVGDAAAGWWRSGGDNDHAKRACHCAIAMVAELQKLNAQFRSKTWPEPTMRIGINTGFVRLGTYGTEKRLRYTALGDAVNLASRLCGLANGQYSHSILLSDATRNMVANDIPTIPVDTVMVKGRDLPMTIYAI